MPERCSPQPRHVDILTNPDDLAAESFDAVVCLDVLEHVPSPPQLVRQLAGYLRPGGYLLSHAPFWFVHPSVGTHLAANRKYSGELRQLYGAAGLRAVDAALAWNPIALEKANRSQETLSPISVPIQAKLCLGGMLLKFSRWWNWPLVTLTPDLNALERRRLRRGTRSTSAWPQENAKIAKISEKVLNKNAKAKAYRGGRPVSPCVPSVLSWLRMYFLI